MDGLLEEREASIALKAADGEKAKTVECGKASLSGAVSQRACVFCGARVVLNPITDAFHLVHGPIGCASYTWDIRGSLSSGSELYRRSFSTDLSERDVVFGGIPKLTAAVDEIVAKFRPPLIFIYSTCLVGVIGDDVDSVCRDAERRHGIRVINVKAPGFAGHKAMGYRLACEAIMDVLQRDPPERGKPQGVNILGDYNLAGEMWIIKGYFKGIGIPVVSTFTGDSSYASMRKANSAALNVVQCAGSMMYLARSMEERFGIPFVKASFFGLEDTRQALLGASDLLGLPGAREKALAFTKRESERVKAALAPYLPKLSGKKAAIFVGGGFKAISLIRQFRELGMETVMVGTQTGQREDYEIIQSLVGPGTVVLDDANPSELERFMRGKGADILVGGVKERPLAYKLGIAFCDHNHERKEPLAGYDGCLNFAREINLSINSPVWGELRGSKDPFRDAA
ncbi:MAG: nitrogenase iron-molybdenum cofactor biosynthesis protein NifE [Deltaproteobacteria bacterium]|jgi:nitrogenase molybdenum-cofactor synthesis protein NifE|nr:nitrogenase iron-molybdenum cofactor biosynthesis protein NifE [Deltaproteobacteria bacterium]